MEQPRGVRRNGEPDRRFWVDDDDYAVAATVALRQGDREALLRMSHALGAGESGRSRVVRALIAFMVREQERAAAGDPAAFPITATLIQLDQALEERRP